MKLEDYRKASYEFSGKASDLNRQLAFAAIALIWLFRKDVGGQPTSIPTELITPSILIVLSLALDMVQYFGASIIWRRLYRTKEDAGVEDDDGLPRHDAALELIIWRFYVAKILCMFAAYALILIFLAKFFLHLV